MHEERISFLDPELRSAHNRIDVLETCSESNAKTIERLERELQEGDNEWGVLIRICLLQSPNLFSVAEMGTWEGSGGQNG